MEALDPLVEHVAHRANQRNVVLEQFGEVEKVTVGLAFVHLLNLLVSRRQLREGTAEGIVLLTVAQNCGGLGQLTSGAGELLAVVNQRFHRGVQFAQLSVELFHPGLLLFKPLYKRCGLGKERKRKEREENVSQKE